MVDVIYNWVECYEKEREKDMHTLLEHVQWELVRQVHSKQQMLRLIFTIQGLMIILKMFYETVESERVTSVSTW